MAAQDLISRLNKVRQTGPGSWIACCPAHEDRTPSLTVKEADDGRVLVHCFAGCAVENIVGAVGMELSDLFPDRPLTVAYAEPRRLRFNARDVLNSVSHELTVISLVLNDVIKGERVTEDDLRRFQKAVERVEEARRYASL